MLIVAGSASLKLAERVAKQLKCRLTKPELRRFPDGELYARIPGEVRGKNVAVIQSTCHSPNENYMELFLLLDAAKDLGAKKVTAVIPYLAYARQDKRFEEGEAVSLRTVAKLVESVGTDEVCVVDMHAHRVEKLSKIFNIPAQNLTAAPLLGKHIAENYQLKNPVVIGPDEEAQQWARAAGEAIGADWDYMIKKRLGPEEVEIKPRKLQVRGRDVIVIDDIISTGGTMIEAIKILKKHGARKIHAACTHGVLVGDALEKIRRAGVREVFATDTIEGEISKVSVAPIIADALR
jgi:ribose-phosphate pyrophosphokinase